jgi:hypothetical protein
MELLTTRVLPRTHLSRRLAMATAGIAWTREVVLADPTRERVRARGRDLR